MLTTIAADVSNGAADIRSCIVPTYMPEIPFDPSITGAHFTSATDYDTKYTVMQDASGRITVCAPGAVEPAIAGSAAICVTR